MNEKVGDMLSSWLDDAESKSQDHGTVDVERSTDAIADTLLIHGLLVDVVRRDDEAEARSLRSIMERIDSESDVKAVTLVTPASRSGRRRFAVLTSAVAIAGAVLLMFVVPGIQQNVSAAMASLEKVIEAAAKPFDRTYRVRVVEEYLREKKPRNFTQNAWERESQQQIDGATLYVRGANQYVLTVMLRSGLKRTSGCDGEVSWAFRENGPVHVSAELNRFRGGLPGQQQDIPFMNIHSHLSQLQTGYDVELSDQQVDATDGMVLSQLVGTRKSRDVRGPKQVNLWFDGNTGTVYRMVLSGLPRGRGGPKSVMLELEDQSDLPLDFFSHDSHHEPGKRIRREDARR